MSSVIVKNNRATANTSQVKLESTGAAYGQVQTHYDENINMYNEPPQNIISLHEFSKKALDRL
jgi:hypothetical protein